MLERGREVLFLASGAEKADAVAQVFAPVAGAAPAPAGRVRPERGALVWLVDRAAASRIPPGRAP